MVYVEAKDWVRRNSPSDGVCTKTETLRLAMHNYLNQTVTVLAATPSMEEERGRLDTIINPPQMLIPHITHDLTGVGERSLAVQLLLATDQTTG